MPNLKAIIWYHDLSEIHWATFYQFTAVRSHSRCSILATRGLC